MAILSINYTETNLPPGFFYNPETREIERKETFFVNVIRQWFIACQSKPLADVLFRDYPNFDHDIWEISAGGDAKLLWSLPPAQEQRTIMKNPSLYHSDLVKWIRDFQNGCLI